LSAVGRTPWYEVPLMLMRPSPKSFQWEGPQRRTLKRLGGKPKQIPVPSTADEFREQAKKLDDELFAPLLPRYSDGQLAGGVLRVRQRLADELIGDANRYQPWLDADTTVRQVADDLRPA